MYQLSFRFESYLELIEFMEEKNLETFAFSIECNKEKVEEEVEILYPL